MNARASRKTNGNGTSAHVYDDDGGAAKDDHRRRNRTLRKWANIFSFIIVFGACICCGLSISRSAASEAHANNKDYVEEMMKHKKARHNKKQEGLREGDPDRARRRSADVPLALAQKILEEKEHFYTPIFPPLPDGRRDPRSKGVRFAGGRGGQVGAHNRADFKVSNAAKTFDWEKIDTPDKVTPQVDYTKLETTYPGLLFDVPDVASDYPPLEPLKDILTRWPQDEIDAPYLPFEEKLLHFDYMDPVQREAATKFRDNNLPFKVYNVPELSAAGEKWINDDYVADSFRRSHRQRPKGKDLLNNHAGEGTDKVKSRMITGAGGHAQESNTNFFVFFVGTRWDVRTMGNPPTMDNDWDYKKWAKHARYADHLSIPWHENHYYYQSGVDRSERFAPEEDKSFISRDLPILGSAEPNFFMWNPNSNKGIQCRFGERGVTAATHYDSGKNMVAMVVGAKRYILAPPKACPKLGIETEKRHPTFRHSVLNFAHLSRLESDDITDFEKEWLRLASDSPAIDTILKAGEVLYIPSHWFHYITSLQKSAQCNTRSGVDKEGTEEFGDFETVRECIGESDEE